MTGLEMQKTIDREEVVSMAYRRESFSPRYGRDVVYSICIDDHETVMSNLKWELSYLQEQIRKFVESFDGKTFEEQLKNASKETIKYDSTEVNVLLKVILSTETFLNNCISRPLSQFTYLKGGKDGREFFNIDNKIGETNEMSRSYDYDNTRLFKEPKNITVKDMNSKEVYVKISTQLRRMRDAFISERKKLFGPRSAYASLGLFE